MTYRHPGVICGADGHCLCWRKDGKPCCDCGDLNPPAAKPRPKLTLEEILAEYQKTLDPAYDLLLKDEDL